MSRWSRGTRRRSPPRGSRWRRPRAGRCSRSRCDTGDDESVAAMAAAVRDRLGGADILVNAAARANTGAVVGIDGFDAAEFGEQVNVKVLGYLRCIRALVPPMRARRLGPDHQRQRAGRAVVGGDHRHGAERGGRRDDQEPGRRARQARDQRHRRPPGRHGHREDAGDPGRAGRARRGQRGGDRAPPRRRVSIGRLVTAEEVASVVAFLASPRSVAVNGDAIAVGGGAVGPVYY